MAEATLTRGTDAAPAPRRAGAPLTRRLAPPLIALTGLIALWQMLSAGPWAGLVAAPVVVAMVAMVEMQGISNSFMHRKRKLLGSM